MPIWQEWPHGNPLAIGPNDVVVNHCPQPAEVDTNPNSLASMLRDSLIENHFHDRKTKPQIGRIRSFIEHPVR
jgi:hypothetical protein